MNALTLADAAGDRSRFHSILVIDRQHGRMLAVCREVGRLPGVRLRGAVADTGLGIVSAVRHAPDCVLLGWCGTGNATADVAAMLKRVRETLKVVIVTATAEEQALAREKVRQACAALPVGDLALCLPEVLDGLPS